MATAMILPVLFFIASTRSEATSRYNNNGHGVSTSFGDILKPPPPPPPHSSILPVPFHGGAPRIQRQNPDLGYQYQPPPPPPPPPLPPSSKFKFPAPFYRQYNFNFVPPPQAFTTTPSSTVFQKVSNWLFPSSPSAQISSAPGLINTLPLKKDCNPCNLVPWIPVVRYDLSGKQLQHSPNPTYGPPSPTAVSNNVPTVYQYIPQQFQPSNNNYKLPIKEGIPHTVYGPPSSYVTPSSTYGPPSPTHTVAVSSNGPSSSTYSIPSSSYGIPKNSYGAPSTTYGSPSLSYGLPSSTYGPPSSTYGSPSSTYGLSISTHGTPAPSIRNPDNNSFRPVTSNYVTPISNNYEPPKTSNVDIFSNNRPSDGLHLPTISHPTGFKNSYGEPITNDYALNIPYPVSATGAESNKIKTEVLPNSNHNQADDNNTFVVAKPAPFTANRGRNIHTLQPVALPNLSVSPLPPIFNARPFRTNTKIYLNNVHDINDIQKTSENVAVSQSIPITEYTHSVEYPATIIQAPLQDLTLVRELNQSKAYRNIPDTYTDNFAHDVSSQASEDHIAATKTNQDTQESSFESTGTGFENELYDNGLPLDLRPNQNINKVPINHKPHFTDLRGVSDKEVDKFRTESNLQSIDSPLLYLKPSAPHKVFDNFVYQISTPAYKNNDYEIYDEIPTTEIPVTSTNAELWHQGSNYAEGLSPPPIAQEAVNKPKIVQIIIPYTTSNKDNSHSDKSYTSHSYNNDLMSQNWISGSEDESQGRKVLSHTDNYSHSNTVTESQYISQSTTTDVPLQTQTVTEYLDPEKYNTHAILNDLYDVKEPPFDIIKLQQNIDDWTEQEYSKRHKASQKGQPSGKYAHAKQIPDEYFTTPNPTIYVTAATDNYNYNYNVYDYEGSSSVQHPVRNNYLNSSTVKSKKVYNSIEKNTEKSSHGRKLHQDDLTKPHIYTAASSFRITTTTPAPWGKIETSISPLTKEKIYVVTSKPWRDNLNVTSWYEGVPFDSKRTPLDNDVSASDNLPFKSPRFLNRPSVTSHGAMESLNPDSSFSFSKSWHQSINELEKEEEESKNSTSVTREPLGVNQSSITTKADKVETTIVGTIN